MNNTEHFWNRIAQKYALKPISDTLAYEKKLEKTQEYLRQDMRVLEVGCGTGTTALTHAPYVQSIRACDFSKNMIHIARQKTEQRAIKNVDFVCEPLTSSLSVANTYDMVMAHSLIHLVNQPDQVIKQVFRVLKPGGYFVSSTACMEGAIRVLKYLWLLPSSLGLLPGLNFIRAQDLTFWNQDAGFCIQHSWQSSPQNLFLIAQKPA